MPLKRYTVVMAPADYDDVDSRYGAVFVEYYTAEDYGHAEEQAKDANAEVTIISVTRDPNPSMLP